MGEYDINTYYMFVEFKAMYDSSDRTGFLRLWRNFMSLENLVVYWSLLLMLQGFKTCNGITEKSKKRLRLGDALSCFYLIWL
jgi:hypothetical protein